MGATIKKQGKLVFLSCLATAALLVVSFPRLEMSFIAWVALVPMLCILDGQKPWRAFRRAYCCGFLFFFAAIGWIIYVTYAGAFLMAAFLALYFALFAVIFLYFQFLPLIPRIFVLSSAWVGLEYFRGHFLSGFGWAMLGHTQYRNLWLIQAADLTDTYGISFLVIMVNLLFFETWRSRRLLTKATLIVMGILAAVLCYGKWTLAHASYDQTVKVGVLEPNIALADTWNDDLKPVIIAKAIRLTRQRLGEGNWDLIVWPESTLPGIISDSPFLVSSIRSTAAALHVPLLFGSMAQEGDKYYNSAFLIGADGQMRGRYDKIHLVPFGEYLPVRPLLGWIDKYVPIDDFTAGRSDTIFSIGHTQKFGVLICFEDTLAELFRRYAADGADFLVNITNDAWFQDTRAPYLHLQAAVFGCVANHRSLARAANTGISALIDPWGRFIARASDENGKETFVETATGGSLPLVRTKTFYTKYGDIFTILCFLCILVAAVLRKI